MCYNHALNLSISKSSNVSSVRNAVSTLRDVASFFNGSAKRHNVLETVLNKALKSCYETRWVDRHDSISQFKSDFLKIYKALDVISNWSENISSPKAEAFKKYIVTVDFVVTLHCLVDVLAVTKPLSVLLQKSNLDKVEAKTLIDATSDTLKKKMQNSEEKFRSVLEEVRNLLEEIGVEVAMPSAEDYYRISVQSEIIDEIILDLHRRLTPENLTTFDLNDFIPSVLINLNDNDVRGKAVNVVSKYGRGFGENAQQLLGSILGCDCDAFNIIKQFLSILGAVSNASSERSFSALRNTMSEMRLTGLALLHIHRETDTHFRQRITAKDKQIVTLRFLATGESYRSLMHQFRIIRSDNITFHP
nr:unnamed protein product [Callosobruchus analis]